MIIEDMIIMRSLSSKICSWLLLLFTSSICFIFVGAGSTLGASSIADTPCDETYYESLAARAWLEAQREITQNQNIILKPDSVFEYTCFDQLLWEFADHADEMFSETSAYGTPLGALSMDNALSDLVLTSLNIYVDNNYGYYPGLLGGHPAALAIKHVLPASIGLGSSAYSCDIMKRVWHAAKCINFVTDADYDGFYTFDEYASSTSDKRRLPTACTAIASNWSANLTTALTSGPWTNDPVQTYFEQTSPQNCSDSNCKCSQDPVPTGIMITGQNPPGPYEEKVCLQPGCRYHPGGFELFSGSGVVGEGCYGR